MPVWLRSGWVRNCCVHQWLHGVDHVVEIALALAAADSGVHERRVLIDARRPPVRDSDDDRLGATAARPRERRLQAPVSRKARRGIEKVLTVVHVDHRITCVTALVRCGRVHEEVASIAQLRAIDGMDLEPCPGGDGLGSGPSSAGKTVGIVALAAPNVCVTLRVPKSVVRGYRTLPVPVALFAAPILSENAARMVAAIVGLLRCAGRRDHSGAARGSSPDPVRSQVSHWRVADVLDTAQLSMPSGSWSSELGRVDRLFGAYEQLQVPLAEVRERLGHRRGWARRRRATSATRRA